MMRNPKTVFPIEWTLSGYQKVFSRAPIFRWFQNSVIITTSVTLAVLFTSTITGYVFAKFRFRYKETLFLLLLATMMVPSQVTMIPTFLIINTLGWYNHFSALIVPALVSVFGIFLARQFIEEIPDSLCEAALIDGCGSFGIYFRVILPQVRPAVSALAIFTFLATWNDYLGPLIMLSDVDRMTLPLALTFFNTNHAMDLGATMSAATLVMLPVIVVFILFQKQFIKGISITGLK
jgi:ABC-type glycerol-3-phosphate transport system permease component